METKGKDNDEEALQKLEVVDWTLERDANKGKDSAPPGKIWLVRPL